MNLTKFKQSPENESIIIINWVILSYYSGVIRFCPKEQCGTKHQPSVQSSWTLAKIEITKMHHQTTDSDPGDEAQN